MQQTKTSNGNKTINARMKLIIYCLFGIMFFFAIAATMTGILIPEMTESYGLTSAQVGLIGSVQSLGAICATAFGGVLSDRFSKLKLIAVSFAVYTAVLYCIGLAPAYSLLLMYFTVLGVTNSYLNLLISAFVSEAYGDKRTTYMNMIHAFFSLGSLAGPVYATVVQKSGQVWNRSFMNLSILCVVITVLFVVVMAPVKSEKQGAANQSVKEMMGNIAGLLSNRRLQLLALLCAAYMGHQTTLSLWITSFVRKGLGLSADIGSSALVMFWGGIVIGRFSQPIIGKYIDYRKWLRATCLISAVLYTAAFLLGSGMFVIVTLFLVGSLTGAAFPTIIAMACELYPELSGTATSAVSLTNSFTTTLLSWFMGVLMGSVGYRAGMMAIPVLMVLCSVILTVLLSDKKKA